MIQTLKIPIQKTLMSKTNDTDYTDIADNVIDTDDTSTEDTKNWYWWYKYRWNWNWY